MQQQKTHIHGLEKENVNLKQQLSKLKEAVEELEQQVREARVKNSQDGNIKIKLGQKIEQLEEENTQLKALKAKLNESLHSAQEKQQQIIQLEQQLRQLEEENAQLKLLQERQLEEENAQLKAKLNALLHSAQGKQEQVQELKDTQEENVKLQQQVQELKDTQEVNVKLQQQLRQREEENVNLKQQIRKLDAAQQTATIIINAFNETIQGQSIGYDKRAELANEFVKKLQATLDHKVSLPIDFKNTAKAAFTDFVRVYNNKLQSAEKEVRLEASDLNPRTWPEAIKDLFIMIAQIIIFPLGIARLAGYDCTVSDSSSKQSAATFVKSCSYEI